MLEKFGAEHIITGSDYPLLLREVPAGKVVEQLENLSDEEVKQMLGDNAIKFLGLTKSNFIKEAIK